MTPAQSQVKERPDQLNHIAAEDQLASETERAMVERKDESRKIGELVELLGHGARLEPRGALEDIGELVLKVRDLRGLQRPGQPEDQVVADDTGGVIDAIEAGHLGHGLVGGG